MANRKLSDIQREALDSRSRLLVDNWDSAYSDVTFRLYGLGEFLDGPDGAEMNRHIPVAVVAALQTFFRHTIISVCNLNAEYRTRAADLLQEKISIKDALGWIGGGAVGFGELVAHSVACNSVADYVSGMNRLLGIEFCEKLKVAVSPTDLRNSTPDPVPVVADVDLLLSRVNDLFRLRHILAHEAASPLKLRISTVKEMYKAALMLVEGTSAVLWATAYSELPLTQFEMNMHALKRVDEETQRMETAFAQVIAYAPNQQVSDWVQGNQDDWVRVCNEWFDNTFGKLDGTMWGSIIGHGRADAIKARTEQLNEWVNANKPDSIDMDDFNARFESLFDY